MKGFARLAPGRRVMRRIFGMVAVAAVLPAIAAGSLTYVLVTQQLESSAQDQLSVTAKDYGLQLAARIDLAVRLLQSTAAPELPGLEVFTGSSLPATGEAGWLTVYRPPSLDSDVNNDIAIWLTDIERRSRSRIASAFLFGSSELFPPGVDLCVMDRSGQLLFCPRGLNEAGSKAWQEQRALNSSGGFRYESREGTRLAAFFTLPENPDFHYPGWSVAAIQLRATALAPAAGFRTATVPAIGIAVVLTLWLGYILVRGRLGPLSKLTDSATRMAAGDLATPVAVHSDDEFGILGTAFERARRALSAQFDTLNALSALDRTILEHADASKVCQNVLEYMQDSLGCEEAWIVVDSEVQSVPSLTYSLDGKSGCREQLTPAGIDWSSVDGRAMRYLDRSAAIIWTDGLASTSRADEFLLLRVASPNKIESAVIIGLQAGRGADRRVRSILESFADRIAVAQQAICHASDLYRQAHYDALTGLPNRQFFLDRLEHATALAESGSRKSALLFIDLDNFKSVNDSQGHEVGDRLLRLAGRRIRRKVGRKDTVARLGGDEFGVILADIESPDDVDTVARTIVDALTAPFRVDSMEHFLGASAGIAMIPDDGDNAALLLKNADTAMYTAKADGRGRTAFFEPEMNERAREHVRLNSELRHAIAKNQLELYYQPKVDLESGALTSAEALIRWKHPELGFVLPDRFIGVAERSNLIVELGEWVAREAGRQIADWRGEGLLDSISINVSSRQIQGGDFEAMALGMARDGAVESGSIELEITESQLIENLEETAPSLARLRAAGFRIAIDDFGTGYSSLAYLSALEFDALKIDKAFIDGFPDDPRKLAIVESILTLAGAVAKHTVAEGVENERQREKLASLGCNAMQGYLLSPPLSAADFETFVRERREARQQRQAS